MVLMWPCLFLGWFWRKTLPENYYPYLYSLTILDMVYKWYVALLQQNDTVKSLSSNYSTVLILKAVLPLV